MDSLRLILLLIGVVIVAGIYLGYRQRPDGNILKFPQLSKLLQRVTRRFSASEKHYYSGRYDDELQADDMEQFPSMKAERDGQLDDEALGFISEYANEYPVTHNGDDLVLVLNIMAIRGKQFNGMDILDVLLANGFVHGDMNIFHYFQGETDKIPVCSIANVIEPGIFELDSIEGVMTPGLSLFMQLPGAVEGRKAFEIMLEKGRAVAAQLEGELCDETRSVLTMQTTGHLKEKIEAWMFKQKMAHLQATR